MPNDTTQPTILVKKADGTSVRMTMDELSRRKVGIPTNASGQDKQTVIAPVKPASVPAPTPVPISAPEQEVKLELPKILHQKSMEEKPTPIQSTEQNMQSKPVRHASLQSVAGGQNKSRREVGIPTEASGQEEKPILKSPTKFVRPTPPVEEKMFIEKWEESDNASLLDDSLAKENLPVIEKEGKYMPTNTTPVKDIFVDEAKYNEKQNKQSRQIKQEVINNIIKFDSPPVKPSDLISKKPVEPIHVPPPVQAPQTKQIIQDIKPPQIVKQSVGPVDELENFSLDDFRRLEINSKAAGLKLIDKFETLKHDSYLLFIDGVKAWYNSPLYKQYQNVFYQSLIHGKSVNEILSVGNVKKDLKLEEFKAILDVNEAVN